MTKKNSDDSVYWDRVYAAFHQGTAPRESVWNEESTPFFSKSISWLKFLDVKNVLDAGCGDGRNLAPFIQAGFEVIGVDYSTTAIECCKRNYPNVSNLKLICCPLADIPLTSGKLDLIICDHVLVHLRNVDEVLKRFYALLRIGGYALLEFTSCLDSTYGQGSKLSAREFVQDGVYLRYDEPDNIAKMLVDFNLLYFSSEHSTDPAHGPGYIRRKRHAHHSYFVVCYKGEAQ
ncbi:MAG: class I SAM-dependent methyltransferase [Patescibacteria group bacterium]